MILTEYFFPSVDGYVGLNHSAPARIKILGEWLGSMSCSIPAAFIKFASKGSGEFHHGYGRVEHSGRSSATVLVLEKEAPTAPTHLSCCAMT
jgi:hypothetical protein